MTNELSFFFFEQFFIFFPDISQQSNSNLTDLLNRSTTATPISSTKENTPETIKNSTSDESIAITTISTNQTAITTNCIEKEIKEIYDSLPPINLNPIESNDLKQIFCSCIFKEKIPEEIIEIENNINDDANDYHHVVVDDDENNDDDIIQIHVPIIVEKPIFIKKPIICVLPPKKPVRSIFDLDYDDDFDPTINLNQKKEHEEEEEQQQIKIVIEDQQQQSTTNLMKIPVKEEDIVVVVKKENDFENIIIPIDNRPEQKWFV